MAPPGSSWTGAKMAIDPQTAHLISQNLMGIAFLVAAVSCASAKRWGFTLFYALAVAETYTKMRYDLLNEMRLIVDGKQYQEFAGLSAQVWAFIALFTCSIIVIASLFLLTRQHRPGTRLIYAGVLGVVTILGWEMVSVGDDFIYGVDLIFSRNDWLYAVCALCSALGAWLGRRQTIAHRPTRRQTDR